MRFAEETLRNTGWNNVFSSRLSHTI